MQIGSVSMGSQATGMPTIPTSISKDDLTTTRPPPSGGMPPAGTSGGRGGPAGAAASQGTSPGASSSSSKDVSTQSDSELEKAANQGDQKAVAELKRREEARVRTQEQSVLDSLDAVRLGAKSGSVE